MRRRRLVPVLSIAVLASVLSASSEPNVCEKLGLETTHLAGATVHYEKSLEPHLPALEKAYKGLLADVEKREALQENRDQILDDIEEILGLTEQKASDVLHQFLSRFLGRLFSMDDPKLYLVTQKTVKDYLRSGGELADYTYNKTADEAIYRPWFAISSESSDLESFEFYVPVASVEECERGIESLFKMLCDSVGGGTLGFGAGVHEVAEMGLLIRGRPMDAHWRWFSDGFAEAIAYHLVDKYMGPEYADEYLEGRDIEDYEEYEQELNLGYWLSNDFCIVTPLEHESKLSSARYAYATYEARRLVGEHGIECVCKILDEVRGRESRRGEDLIVAVEKVTGSDIKERLLRYQTFKTAERGINNYTEAFNAASKEKDHEQMLINLIRLHEIRPMLFSPTCLRDYRESAVLLNKLGYEQDADKLVHRCISLFERSPVPHGREAAMETFLLYSLDCRQPRRGLAVAEELLDRKPDNSLALTVQMLSDAELGRIGRARETARLIQTLVPEDKRQESLAYKHASDILSFDPGGARANDPNGFGVED